jgi:multiple sugar transport system substrate-binding protein
MEQPGGQGRNFGVRFLLIFVVILAVIAIAAGSLLLTRDIQSGWDLWAVVQLFVAGALTGLSAVATNVLIDVLKAIWNLDPHVISTLRDKLKKPVRWLGIGLTAAALVATGVWLVPSNELEPGDLVIMTAFPADPKDARTMLLDQWNRLNPDNQARFDFVALSHDEQHARMVRDAEPDGDHEADLYVLDIVWMAEFIERAYVRQLDESALSVDDRADFVTKILETCQDESGNLWALPFNSDVGLIHLRTDFPERVVPEESWDEYFGQPAKNTAAAARASHPDIQAAHTAQLSVEDEMLTISALEAMWAAGGRMVGPNGQLAMNADESEVIFGPLDLAGLEKLAVAYHDPEIALQVENADAASRAFADGHTVFMRNWPVARDNIGDRVPFVAAAPPHASVLGGQNLAISAETDKPRAAQALIQFLTSAASQQILSEVGGFVPTRDSAFTNARRPDIEQIESALDDARLRPVTPCYVTFSQLFRLGMHRALEAGGKLEPGFTRDLARAYKCRQ